MELEKLKQSEDNVKNIMTNKIYQMHSFKDYKQLKQMYDQNYKRLGGLGPNVGSEEWSLKKEKQEKMREYVQSLRRINNVNKI